MTTKTEEAIGVLKNLSDEDADIVADAVIGYANAGDFQLSDEQVAEIERRMKDPQRKFLSLTELDKRVQSFDA